MSLNVSITDLLSSLILQAFVPRNYDPFARARLFETPALDQESVSSLILRRFAARVVLVEKQPLSEVAT